MGRLTQQNMEGLLGLVLHISKDLESPTIKLFKDKDFCLTTVVHDNMPEKTWCLISSSTGVDNAPRP